MTLHTYTLELQAKVPEKLKDFTITEKAPTRAFSWLKAPTSTFTFKTLSTQKLRISLCVRRVETGSRYNGSALRGRMTDKSWSFRK